MRNPSNVKTRARMSTIIVTNTIERALVIIIKKNQKKKIDDSKKSNAMQRVGTVLLYARVNASFA